MAILNDILDGNCDEHLDRIVSAVEQRKRTLALKEVASLNVGDTVVFTNISPKYLNGKTAQVVELLGDKVKVQMPLNPAYRRYSGCIVTASASIVKAA